jgi:uncharacterized protein YktA (UPF0223 family)
MKEDNRFHNDEYYSLKEMIALVKEWAKEELASAQKLNDTKFLHIKEDTEKALASNSIRLDSMNEIKGAMKDQQAHFPTREELEPRLKQLEECRLTMMSKVDYETRHDAVLETLKRLEISKAIVDSKADQKSVDDKFESVQNNTNWTRVFLILTALLAAAGILIDIFKK